MLDVSTEDVTEGPLLRALLVLAAPLVAQNFVRAANQVVDVFWLGRLSETAVAGVGLTVPFVGLAFAFIGFLPLVGTQVLVSQRIGADDDAAARRTLVTGIVTAFTLGAVAAALTFLWADALLGVLTAVSPGNGGERAVRQAAASYLRIYGLGFVVFAVSDTVEAGFVGWGDSRASLYMNLTAVLVNVALDPLLIFGAGPVPALGIEGAALATVGGESSGFLVGASMVAAGRNGGMLSRAATRLRLAEFRELFDVGLPTAGQNAARQTARLAVVVVAFLAGGGAGVAAYHVGAQVAAFAFIPAIGLKQAVQSVVGQNLGAKHPSRAGRATWQGVAVATVGLSVLGAVQWLFPAEILALLVPELSGEAAVFAHDYLRILAYGYPAIGAAYLFEGGFNGARRTRTAFVATLLQFWVVRLPIAVVGGLTLAMGVHAVFWAVTLSNVLVAVGLTIYYWYSERAGMLNRAVIDASS